MDNIEEVVDLILNFNKYEFNEEIRNLKLRKLIYDNRADVIKTLEVARDLLNEKAANEKGLYLFNKYLDMSQLIIIVIEFIDTIFIK